MGTPRSRAPSPPSLYHPSQTHKDALAMAGEKPDAFAEQQAALNAPPPKKWVPSARAFGYAILLFLLFGVACGQLGIWSYFLQKLGNIRRVEDYPNRETMQTGNMLFATSLITILVGAGILTDQIPFSTGCSAVSSPSWQPQQDDCKKWVAYEALAWTNFALAWLLLCLLLADVYNSKKKAKRDSEGAHKRHYLLGQ